MRVSVVVPTYRRPDLLLRCLDALHRQQFDPSQFEVIVADDAAEEGTRAQVESRITGLPAIRYIPVEGAHGPAAARNAGWRAAQGDIIAFTDDDCLPDSGWLAAGSAAFEDAAVIAVTGQTIVPLPPNPSDYERNTAGLETSEFITANCLCRRRVLADIGGFDEQFTTAWREDSDLHFRLLETGGKVVRVAAAVVVHPVRQAVWGVSLREQRKAMFDALLYRKHPRLFRERIRPLWPARYYVMAACLIGAAVLAVNRQPWLALVFFALWFVLMLEFIGRRLKTTRRDPAHVVEMAVTSLAIPFLSIYWRLHGAIRFGTLFW